MPIADSNYTAASLIEDRFLKGVFKELFDRYIKYGEREISPFHRRLINYYFNYPSHTTSYIEFSKSGAVLTIKKMTIEFYYGDSEATTRLVKSLSV